ncbi:MAG: TetR/AcrR family transcriptional regulator [Candidatus Rokubacteria bacterium]|nr:TetR/AcrR family transcriptional regulator [Candidatus Rokubacteria bacterium]MBI2013934.1 TetR/AcrR family transcriptional regulator [Candidatus Rokubacteria bacterium]MBI2493779.1 TetR/AcrR family transcriptional regulator [Candidatus Rokubacteria bacterium]
MAVPGGHTLKDAALAEARQREIAGTALRLFRARGYHATSVRQIAEAAGLSVGSLFNYFRSKEQVLQLIYEQAQVLIEEALDQVMHELGPDPEAALRHALDRYVGLLDQYQDHVALLYQEFKSLDGRAKRQIIDRERRIMAIFERILEAGVRQKKFRPQPLAVTVNAIAALGHSWVTRRWALGGAVTLEEFKEAQIAMILGGIRDEVAARGRRSNHV